MNKINVLDLFAGCGGLSKGFENAGFNIIAANDDWKPAAETHIANHPNSKFFLGDITKEDIKKEIIDFCKKKGCDVVVGGPPCQAYSMAGLRDLNDPRGKLFEDYVEIVTKLQPKIFVMENVKGILTMKHYRDNLSKEEKQELSKFMKLDKEKADLLLLRKQSKNNPERFKFTKDDEKKLEQLKEEVKNVRKQIDNLFELVTDKIKKRFKKIGYDVDFSVLNSADFGVPQKRERVIFIGKKEDGPVTFPEPTHSMNSKENLSNWTKRMKIKPWKTVKEAIGDLETLEENHTINHVFTSHNDDFTKKIKNTPIGKSVFGNYSDAFFKAPPNEPSRTVKENHGGVFVHYSKDRVMTPRELARLQSFPDDFVFMGSKSTILKQIGNAVPVGLAEAIGKHVKNLLKEYD